MRSRLGPSSAGLRDALGHQGLERGRARVLCADDVEPLARALRVCQSGQSGKAHSGEDTRRRGAKNEKVEDTSAS